MRHGGALLVLTGCILTEGILIGYVVGRNDERIKAALVAKADRAIAHAKAVPPAAIVSRETIRGVSA